MIVLEVERGDDVIAVSIIVVNIGVIVVVVVIVISVFLFRKSENIIALNQFRVLASLHFGHFFTFPAFWFV